MKTIGIGFGLGVAGWLISTVLMAIAVATHNLIGDTLYALIYWFANWPLIFWERFAPIEDTSNAYTIGLLRNLIGWCVLGTYFGLCRFIIRKINKRKAE